MDVNRPDIKWEFEAGTGGLLVFVAVKEDDIVADLTYSFLTKLWTCKHPEGEGVANSADEAIQTAVSDKSFADSLISVLSEDIDQIGHVRPDLDPLRALVVNQSRHYHPDCE